MKDCITAATGWRRRRLESEAGRSNVFSQSTGSIGPTMNPQASAPIQATPRGNEEWPIKAACTVRGEIPSALARPLPRSFQRSSARRPIVLRRAVPPEFASRPRCCNNRCQERPQSARAADKNISRRHCGQNQRNANPHLSDDQRPLARLRRIGSRLDPSIGSFPHTIAAIADIRKSSPPYLAISFIENSRSVSDRRATRSPENTESN